MNRWQASETAPRCLRGHISLLEARDRLALGVAATVPRRRSVGLWVAWAVLAGPVVVAGVLWWLSC